MLIPSFLGIGKFPFPAKPAQLTLLACRIFNEEIGAETREREAFKPKVII